MRMRFKKYAGPELDNWHACVRNPADYAGKWNSAFERKEQDIYLELGCGKGSFIAKHAAQNPHINYIGIDITDKVLVLAKRNIEREFLQKQRKTDNVIITAFDIERINNMLKTPDEISRIYINFCNPWNKKSGQKKHRLTYTRQLNLYKEFMKSDAQIFFKCDDDNLFEDSLLYFKEANFDIVYQTLDLHANESEFPIENIRTEHENMFAQRGILTHALIAQKKTASNTGIIEKNMI